MQLTIGVYATADCLQMFPWPEVRLFHPRLTTQFPLETPCFWAIVHRAASICSNRRGG